MHEIRMPRLNNNDDTGILDRWLVADGEPVTSDTVIAVIETSKASYDLTSEVEGVLHRLLEEGEERPIGELIGYVFADEAQRQAFLRQGGDGGSATETSAAAGPVITRSARELMAAAGITEAEAAGLGKKVIRRADLEPLLQVPEAGEADETLELSRRQRAIAETVSRSHAAIPRAFTAIRLACDAALDRLAVAAERDGLRAGLPELLVRALGTLRDDFPFFYGEVLDGHRFRPAPAADVGVTVDVGQGLFIPVLRSPATRTIAEVADVLMDFRIKALRNDFHQEELTGGAITLSLNNDDDVILAEPLILPGQSCMVSLGAVLSELARAADGGIVERRHASLGISYDHRVINGSDAVAFLRALGERVESIAATEAER